MIAPFSYRALTVDRDSLEDAIGVSSVVREKLAGRGGERRFEPAEQVISSLRVDHEGRGDQEPVSEAPAVLSARVEEEPMFEAVTKNNGAWIHLGGKPRKVILVGDELDREQQSPAADIAY